MGGLSVTKSSGEKTDLEEAALKKFRSSLQGTIILPGDDAYEDARKIWNGMIDKKPGLMVKCRESADVISCVNLARERDLLLAVRGGGHNVAGNAVCNGGLVVDLSEMRSVRADVQNNVVHIADGVPLGCGPRDICARSRHSHGGGDGHRLCRSRFTWRHGLADEKTRIGSGQHCRR